jgi:hypothetical protein
MEIENEEIHKQNCRVYLDTCLPERSSALSRHANFLTALGAEMKPVFYRT